MWVHWNKILEYYLDNCSLLKISQWSILHFGWLVFDSPFIFFSQFFFSLDLFDSFSIFYSSFQCVVFNLSFYFFFFFHLLVLPLFISSVSNLFFPLPFYALNCVFCTLSYLWLVVASIMWLSISSFCIILVSLTCLDRQTNTSNQCVWRDTNMTTNI
jgi:hypothetical protein